MGKLLCCVLAIVAAASVKSSADSVGSTFEFINQVQRNLKLTNNPNVILVIGNSGSGKSTLVHYIAADYSKLVSLEPVGDETEYKIHDELDPEIGNILSTTVSRTLVPELIIDEKKNVWYDCPGFGDTRNQTVEIATTFMIKSAIENALSVKIVLVVNYASVTESYDRFDLERLMTRATQLINNIDRYKNSVSLVVSKAPPYWMKGRRPIEIFEESVKKSTANYMSKYRLVQQEKGSNEKKIHLVDALLKKTSSGDYPKISVFWRPSDAGAFNTIGKMIDGRQKIRNSILEQSSYTEIQQNDFGFPLTNGAQIHIANMARHTIADISTLLTNIDNRVLNALEQKIESIDSFHDRLELLVIGERSIQIINNKVATLKQLTDRFAGLIKSLNITAMNTELNRIDKHEKNLNILKSIVHTGIIFPIRDWVAVSNRAIDFVTTEHTWSSFLVQVYEFFASYEVQNNIAVYNVANLSDWGSLNRPQGLRIVASNFNEFTKRFPGSTGATLTTSKLKELNEIIEITLRSPVHYECDGETMTIKGKFVKSSDIQPAMCPSNRISKINVFVVSTFYVDNDLRLNGFKGLNIFGNKWKILRATTFNLSGFDGESQERPQFSGTAGNPGNAGTNAGNFVGLSNELINGESLTVKLHGGNGASGQDGTGSSDVEASFTRREHHKMVPFMQYDMTNFYKDFLKEKGYDAEFIRSESRIKYYAVLAGGKENILRFRIYPEHCCGQTGLGGPGGLGGQAGKYIFLQTGSRKNKLPKLSAIIGSNGSEGTSATTCKNTALEIRIDNIFHSLPILMLKLESKFIIENRVKNKRCSDEIISSTAAIPRPLVSETLKVIPAINEYKIFLRENLRHSPLRRAIRDAYDLIDSDPEISGTYAVADFAVEMNALERQFYELNEHVDLFTFYDNLRKRIESYAIANQPKLVVSDRKVLTLLCTTILSKTSIMRSGHKSDLIIEIESFFELIVRNIKELDETGRIRVINQQRDKYNSDILAKIDEASGYIKNEIEPEIEKMIKALNSEMQKIIDETISLRAKTAKEIKTKEKNAKIIRRNAAIRKVSGVLDVVGKAASFLGPEGKIVAGVISAGTSITKEILVESKIEKHEMPANVKKLQNELGNKFNKINQEKIDAIESELEKLIKSLKGMKAENYKFDDTLGSLISKVKSIKSKNSLFHDDIQKLLRKFTDFINDQQKKLAAVDEAAHIREQIKRTENALAVIAASSSMYSQFATDDKKLDTIGQAINEDRNSLIALIAFEDEIYAELIPMTNAMHDNLDAVEKNLAGKSSVALDVQKWKIRDTLHSVKRKLGLSIGGLKNEYGVANCVVKIDEAINLIINIYDRIQNYQEQSKLAVYLSEMHSVNYRNMDVVDPQLKDHLNQLHFNLQANIILSQYYRAVDGFKQAVFPFAAEYLDIYQLPATFTADKNLDTVVSTAADKIKSLSERIKELNMTVINENDVSISSAYFDSDSRASGPFYVWKNDEVRAILEQLFAGKKVYLLADVTRSCKLNAIKFNTIDLDFHSSNKTINDQLQNVLQSFHVSLTHSGESHYRCNNQFYTISSRAQTITYSFGEKKQMPIVRNVVYDKLRSGVKLLSPYTLWTVQLSHGRFGKLKPFVDSVDIGLHGQGQFVNEGAAICNTDLQKFYSPHYTQ